MSEKDIKCIRCENPQIIYNPYLKLIYKSYNAYVIKDRKPCLIPLTLDETYLYQYFSKRALHIFTLQDVEQSYLLNTSTGEICPIYMCVPCGKCVLCRDKKICDWKARAFCECSTSGNIPYHFTLTLNNEHLTDGLVKSDLQKFFKRLRSYLEYHGYDNKIKYAACGEYGEQKHRPHYHVILWNLPHLTSTQLLHIIEKCWDKGFVYIRSADAKRIGYVLKYINKEGHCPEGKEPPFFTSSKRTAIGYEYLMDNIQYFIENPSLNFEVYDPFTGSLKRFGLPQYFIRKIYPTLSTLIPKEIRDSFIRMATIHNKLKRYSEYYIPHPAVLHCIDKFSFLPCSYYDKLTSHDDVMKDYDEMLVCAKQCYDYVLPDVRNILGRKDVRRKLIDDYFSEHPYTIEMLENDVEEIKKHTKEQLLRELCADVPF